MATATSEIPSGEATGLGGSGIRFWTLMWDLRHCFGRIDRYQAQRIMSGLYAHDRETGDRIDCARDEHGAWRIWGEVEPCNQGSVSLRGGTADGKVAVLEDRSTAVSWTMGSPSHWEGAWDQFSFQGGQP